MGRFEDVLPKAVSEMQANTTQVLSGSALPQEKVKLAYKLFGVSSRIYRVLVFLDRVVYTNPLVLYFLAGGVRAGEQPTPGQFRARCSERASEEAFVQESCPSREDEETLQDQKRLAYSIYNAVD